MLTLEEAAKYVGIDTEDMMEIINNGDRPCKLLGKGYIRIADLASILYSGVERNEVENIVEKPLDSGLPLCYPSTPLIEDLSEEEFELIRRERGLGSVYYNKQRECWQAAFYIVENGEKKRKIISAKSEDEAIIQMSLLRAGGMAFVKDEDVSTNKVCKKHKITDIWQYILEKEIKPGCESNTYKWYSDMGKHIINGFSDKTVEDLTPNEIQDFLNSKKIKPKNGKPYSEKFIKEVNALVRKVCFFSMEEGYIHKNPYNRNVKKPKGVKRNPRAALEIVEATRVMSAVSGSPVFRTVVYSLMLTGMRIGEFLALKWSDLDRENNIISINNAIAPEYDEDEEGNFRKTGYEMKDTKTEAGTRLLPVDPSFFKVMDVWKEYMLKDKKRMKAVEDKDNTNLIFPNNRGDIRSYQSFRRQFGRFLAENGLGDEGITFHCLRRTLASRMVDAGVRLEVIASYLGHEVEGYEGNQQALCKNQSKA